MIPIPGSQHNFVGRLTVLTPAEKRLADQKNHHGAERARLTSLDWVIQVNPERPKGAGVFGQGFGRDNTMGTEARVCADHRIDRTVQCFIDAKAPRHVLEEHAKCPLEIVSQVPRSFDNPNEGVGQQGQFTAGPGRGDPVPHAPPTKRPALFGPFRDWYTSWNLYRRCPEPRQIKLRRIHREQAGCFSSHLWHSKQQDSIDESTQHTFFFCWRQSHARSAWPDGTSFFRL